MIFTAERPLTADHVRDVCARFNEGVRVEYKGIFDANVRNHLPKIVASFANSQGGVLVVGVRAVNGVPEQPYEGFPNEPKEELPLTVENICLRNINPPVIPITHVVQSDVPGQVFLIIEVEESGEAPHAIENSKKVYVRTGSAANPYDLAEVDLVIELMKRRREPLERRDRLIKLAEQRSIQNVNRDQPFVQISICPVFPRLPLCSTQETWNFLNLAQMNNAIGLVYPNSVRRVPDGTASLIYQDANLPHLPPQYLELGKYGLFFTARQFRIIGWNPPADPSPQLYFANLFQTLLRLTVSAEQFFSAQAYRGNLIMNVSVHCVRGHAMRFIAVDHWGDNANDYRCYADTVSAERIVMADQMRLERLEVLTGILCDLTWGFWQSNAAFPAGRVRENVEQMIQQLRV